MRLTNDEAMRLKDQFDDFIEGMIGEDISFKRNPDSFSLEILRKQARRSVDTSKMIGGPDSRKLHDPRLSV